MPPKMEPRATEALVLLEERGSALLLVRAALSRRERRATAADSRRCEMESLAALPWAFAFSSWAMATRCAFARAILMRWRAFFSSFLRPATRASMKRSSTRSRPTAYLGLGLGLGFGLGLGLGLGLRLGLP